MRSTASAHVDGDARDDQSLSLEECADAEPHHRVVLHREHPHSRALAAPSQIRCVPTARGLRRRVRPSSPHSARMAVRAARPPLGRPSRVGLPPSRSPRAPPRGIPFFRVEREQPAVRGANGHRVMAERARGGSGRRVPVVRGGVAHHIFERDLGTPLTLELVDPVDGDECAGDVARDRVEDLELPPEALTGRPFDVEDADDFVARPERHDHRLAGLRVAAPETLVVDRPERTTVSPGWRPIRRSPRRPVARDRAARRSRRRADPEAIALHEHDRRPASPHPSGDVLGCPREKGRCVACLLDSGEQVLEKRDPIVVLGAFMLRVRHSATVADAHREELGCGARRRELDGVKGHAVPQRAEKRFAVRQIHAGEERERRVVLPATRRRPACRPSCH